MKHKKWKKVLSISMIFLLLLLTGCNKSGDEKDSKKGPQNKEETVQNNKEGKTNETTNIDEIGESGDDVETEGDYSNIIFNRSLVKGKFATYFFRSDVLYQSYSWKGKGGDSVFLISPDGKTLLYDCSTPMNAPYIASALQKLGVKKIDYFVNSHPHIDHLGGFSIISRYFDIGHIYLMPCENGYTNITAQGGYAVAFWERVQELKIPYSYLAEGDTFQFGTDVSVKVYNPPGNVDFDAVGYDYNETSLILKFIYKDSSVLLAGDTGNNAEKLGRATETELARKYGSELQADVSKMNHHGDANANGNTKAGSPDWLNAVNSKIYVGMYGSFTDVKQYYTYVATGAKVFHSSMDGTVLVYTSGNGTYDVQVERDRYVDTYGKYDMVDGHMTVK